MGSSTSSQMFESEAKIGVSCRDAIGPLDFLMFAALVYEIGQDLETQRLPYSTQADQTVASNRFHPNEDGSMFDPDVGFRSFHDRSTDCAIGRLRICGVN